MEKGKYILSTFLFLVILTSSIYFVLNDNVRIDIQETRSIFKVQIDGKWVTSGIEYVNLFDGTAKMRASGRTLGVETYGNDTIVTRTAQYKNNILVVETYIFQSNTSDVTLFPISHDIRVIGADRPERPYILQYEVQKLLYTGETIKDIESPQEFGHDMQVEWEDGNYYSRIYKYADKDEGKLTVKYRINESIFDKNVRLFDPPEDAFTITEHTEYGFAENTIYINITENLGKNQNINITHIFDENHLTNQIHYTDFELKQDVEQDIYGLVNVSLGKYKNIINRLENDSTYYDYESDDGAVLCTSYFENETEILSGCGYILGDKSVLREETGVIGKQIVQNFMDMPVLKEKTVISGLKIDNKQSGIAMPKDSTIEVRLTYSHPLAIQENLPTYMQNKYDIEVCSLDGLDCTILDPTWWNTSWGHYKEYTNLTGNISYMFIDATSSDNADFNDTKFLSCTNATLVFNHTLEATIGTSGQFRVNNLGENCTRRYYDNPEASSTSSASDVYFNPSGAYYYDANANDSIGSNDGTVFGATLTTGYINGSYDFEVSESDYIDLPFAQTLINLDGGAVSVWVNPESFPAAGSFVFQHAFSGDSLYFFALSDGTIRLTIGSSSTSFYPISSGSWSHLAAKWNGTDAEFYINGVSKQTVSYTYSAVGNNDLNVGRAEDSSNRWWDGLIDELYFLTQNTTQDQIIAFYTQTAPNFIEGAEQNQTIIGPVVTLISPDNNSVETSQYVIFNTTVTDDELVQNVSLILDGVLNQTNTSQFNGTYIFNVSIPESNHNWSILAYNNASQSAQSETRFFISDFFDPTVSIDFPVNSANYNFKPTTLNTTASDTHLEACWYSLDNFTTNTTFTCNTDVTGLLADEGVNYWRACANDSVGKEACGLSTFEVDTINPNVTIIYPINGTYYNSTVTQLNYTVVDNNSDSCWYSIDGGITNSSSVVTGINFTVSSSEGQNNWTVYCNDTFSNEGTDDVIFYHDTTSPSVTINRPNDIEEVNWNESLITYNVTSNELLPLCLASLDSFTTNHSLNTSDNLTFYGNITTSIGDQVVDYYCEDYAENTNYTSKSFEVRRSLIVDSETISIGGDFTYYIVNITSTGIVNINGTGYLNITGLESIIMDGTINGLGKVAGGNGGDDPGAEGGDSGSGTGAGGGAGVTATKVGGGGAGGHYTNGGKGGTDEGGSAGSSYGNVSTYNSCTFGSGGGGGATSSGGSTNGNAGDGGGGAGCVILNSHSMSLSGTFNFYGGNGGNDLGVGTATAGGGGGGSGGEIIIIGYDVNISSSILRVYGGSGGIGGRGGADCGGGGGGGAGGFIKVFYDRLLTSNGTTASISGGTGGTGVDRCSGETSSSVNGITGGSGIYSTQSIIHSPVEVYNPIENSYNKNEILFNCSTRVENYTNLTLIIDGFNNYTLNGSGELLNLLQSLNLTDGLHNVTCSATNTDNSTFTFPVFDFYADSSPPTIEQLSPIDNFISENVSNNFTVNLTDNLSGLKNASLYTGFAGTWDLKYTNSSLNNASNLNITFTEDILPENSWSIRFCDALGNCNWTENRTIFLDTYDPIINILFPENTSYIINVSEINYTVFDNYPDSCWYSMDNGATNSSPVSSGINFTGVVSSIGQNTATVYCNDSRSNVGSNSVTYTLDAIRYTADSNPTNTSTSGVGQVFINVTINPIIDRQNISFRGYNLTNGSITQYLSNDFTNSTNYTNLTSATNPFYWDVILYDTNNVSHILSTRYKGLEEVNFSMNGTFGNITAELGADISINATSNIYNVSIDVDHPSYGANYSNGFLNTGFELVINWFRSTIFANDLTYQIINFSTGFGVDENKTFNLTAHQYDEIVNVSINISGINDPQGVAFYKANSSEYDRVFFGNLTSSGYIQQDRLLDRSTTPNQYNTSQTISFDNEGTAFTYFLLDDSAKLVNFILDIVSIEYGFTFADDFYTDDYMDSVLTTTIKKLGVVVPDGTNLREILIDDFEDAVINSSIWILVISITSSDFSHTVTTAEVNGYLQIGVSGSEDLPGASESDIDADFVSNQYIYLSPNDSYIYSVDDYKVDFTFYLDGEESSPETTGDCSNSVSVSTNNINVFFLDLLDGDDDITRTTYSVGNMSMLISWYNSTHYSVLTNGTDKQTGYDYSCGDFEYTRYWNYGQRNYTSEDCPTTTTSLSNPFYITQDTFTLSNGLVFNVNNNHDADLVTGLTDVCLGDGYYCSSLTSPCTGVELVCRNYDGTSEGSCETGPPWHIGTCTWYDTISNVIEGCNNFNSYLRVLNVNRSIKTPIDSTYYSSSVFDSSIPITAITMQETIFTDFSEIFNFISTNDGDNYQNIILNQSTPITNPGDHVKFRTDFEINESLGWYPNWPLLVDVEITSTPSNLSNLTFDFGNDGIIDYTIDGEISIANGTLEVDLSSADISSAFIDTAIVGKTHLVPLVIGSDSAGAIILSDINLTYNPNPVYLNYSSIQSYLINYGNEETIVPMIIEGSGNNSIVNISDLRFDYAGGNDTIEITAHNLDYSQSLTRNIIYYYSRWDYEWIPENVEWIYFSPSSPIDLNVTPYGQTDDVPLFNITNYGYGGKNASLSVYVNNSLDCVNMTMSLTSNKEDGFIVNESWINITDMEYLETINISLWSDYSCNYTTWRLFNPYIYFRPCVDGGICSTDLI